MNKPKCQNQAHPLILVTANSAWNIYSRKRLLTALQKSGYDVIGMGAAGSVSGTKQSFTKESSQPESEGKSVTVSTSPNDPYAEKLFTETGIPFLPLPMEGDGTKMLKDINLFSLFCKIYRTRKPAAVLHFNNKPNIYGSIAAALHGIPSINNVTGLGVVAEKKGITASVVYFLYRLAFASKKTFVFFQNGDDRQFFLERKLVPQRRTGLLPGSGVDTERFKPQLTKNSEAESSGTIEAERSVHFLFNGRLLITKGICNYIDAAYIVKKMYPKTEFAVIGEHDAKNPIFIPWERLQTAITDGTISWYGLVPDVVPYVQYADCVVLPSYYREGVPRVLLEAAAMGKALIAADSIGTKEPVEDGKNGYLTPPSDTASLADTMLRYIRLSAAEKRQMGTVSRTIAETRFSDTIIINSYLERLTAAVSSRER